MKNINILIGLLFITSLTFGQGNIKVNVKTNDANGYLLNGNPFSGGSSIDTVVISNVDTIYVNGGGNGNDTIWVCDSAGTIHSNGTNVGIGTTTPTELLGLTSTGGTRARIQIQNDSTTNGGLLMGLNKNGAAVFRLKEDKAMRFYANDSESMVLTKGGNLNLGNTNYSNATKIRITSTVNGGLLMGLNANGHAELRQKEDKDLRFYTNNNEAMRIKKDGRVGIGVNNPETTFDVAGTAKVSDYMKIGENSIYIHQLNGATNGNGNHIYGGSGEDLYLQAITGSGGVISGTPGNLGIGTTDPSAKLDVVGNIVGDAYSLKIPVPNSGIITAQPVLSAKGRTTVKLGVDVAPSLSGQVETSATEKNTLMGYCSGLNAGTTFSHNTFLGTFAGQHIINSVGNTFIGESAGKEATKGDNNIIIGRNAGRLQPGGGNLTDAGNLNLVIGINAKMTNDLINASAIGTNAEVSQSNSMVLGNNVNVGIGTSAPSAKLDVVGKGVIQDANPVFGAQPDVQLQVETGTKVGL